MNEDMPLNLENVSEAPDFELMELSLNELAEIAGGPQLTNDGII